MVAMTTASRLLSGASAFAALSYKRTLATAAAAQTPLASSTSFYSTPLWTTSFPSKNIFREEVHLSSDEDFAAAKSYSFDDFGIEVPSGAFSSFAATEPFRLLSDEGVAALRAELTPELRAECKFSSPIAPCVLRGLNGKSQFIRDLWDSPMISHRLSQLSGLDIVPHGQSLERAHVNVQCPKPENAGKNTFDWHFDSQPFVCILMLSDVPANAIGGETLIHLPGETEHKKLVFPGAGYAYLLQGSHVKHAASSAKNYMRESMITSFVPRDPTVGIDGSDVRLSSTYSPREQLFDEYLNDRLRYVGERALTLKQKRPGGIPSAKDIDEIQTLINILEQTRENLQEARST